MNLETIFKDLKVVELASVLAGPAVGMFFAELGAKVIKIENKTTRGDTTRHWKLPGEDRSKNYSAYFHSVNWGKEHLFLDLKDSASFEQAIAIIKEADILVSNYKMSSAEKLGLSYAQLAELNPQLIYAAITAYGEDDPRPGFDVVIQAETGWLSMNGEAGGAPVKLPVALMDILAAHQLKEAILIALIQRMKTGKGAKVSVSLFDAAVASLANQASNWLNEQHLPKRMGSQHPNIAPYGDIHYSKDGLPIIISTGTAKQYFSLLDALGLSDLKADPRFETNEKRLVSRTALNEYLKKGFEQMNADELLGMAEELNIPLAPIRNLKELFELPASKALILNKQLEDGKNSQRVRTAVFKIKANDQ